MQSIWHKIAYKVCYTIKNNQPTTLRPCFEGVCLLVDEN